ncbi:two-component system, NarL family, response regulator DesR [Amycolatopsis xylanica]|uniref:Two-component system, NarL family, response regulator DesR n=1 Tax=Amycolatopsis xylanica TaxID=589385 RepID=A0A1H3DGS1_9PSEU|nr:response regulator transcription factor [Amycolatopsis xylanica]SDX65557.1 two-component system, NarL family, response regulator DesR [Amycolatopsis xylanica]
MKAEQVRVFLAEDQVMVRSALVSLIELEPDLCVVGVAGRGDQAVERIAELRPDVAVLDIDMPGLDGLSAAEAVRTRVPGCAALILTALSKPGMLQRALQAGAKGYVVKHAPADELLAAIRGVAAGERVFDSALAVAALEEDVPVTQRELDVVRLVAEGASAREIAGRLFLSEGTVRNYTSNMINKCGARNRVDLVRIAFDRGWL